MVTRREHGGAYAAGSDVFISFVGWISLFVSMASAARVEEYLMKRLSFIVRLQNLVVTRRGLRFLVELLTGGRDEQRWSREGHELVTCVVSFDLTVREESVSHLVQIASQFIVDKEIEVALVQFCQLAFGEEVRCHLLG